MENVAGASFNLPRKHGVAYSAQESWLQNETIVSGTVLSFIFKRAFLRRFDPPNLNQRDNILFGTPFDEARYMTVIQHCALERDLTLFSAGDETEVGEKGLTLSGGQKVSGRSTPLFFCMNLHLFCPTQARVALARAFYSHASIVLLDDILSALDVHTCHHIVDNLLKGDLVKDRTIILVVSKTECPFDSRVLQN